MKKILFAGEGGQGVQAAAQILTQAAFTQGQAAAYIPNFGVEQRGGISLAFVVVDQKPVVYPKFEKADILAILSDRALERVNRYLDAKTQVVYGPASAKGPKTALPAKVGNVIVLGEVNRRGQVVTEAALIAAMKERFARQFKKRPELEQLDLKALQGVEK